MLIKVVSGSIVKEGGNVFFLGADHMTFLAGRGLYL